MKHDWEHVCSNRQSFGSVKSAAGLLSCRGLLLVMCTFPAFRTYHTDVSSLVTEMLKRIRQKSQTNRSKTRSIVKESGGSGGAKRLLGNLNFHHLLPLPELPYVHLIPNLRKTAQHVQRSRRREDVGIELGRQQHEDVTCDTPRGRTYAACICHLQMREHKYAQQDQNTRTSYSKLSYG